MTNADPEVSEKVEESPLYHISLQRLAELNRSAVALMEERLGASRLSRGRKGKEPGNAQKLLDEIAKQHGDEEGFIRTEMPIQEMVFRILLSRRNEPTALGELHYEVTERWATPVRPINVSGQGLGRILDADTFYGFAKVAPGS